MNHYHEFYPIDAARIPEAVERVNQLRTWFNNAAPEIIRIVSGAKIIANGCALNKRDMGRVNPILATAPYRAWLSVSGGSVWLHADITYPVKVYESGHSVNYYEEAAYMGPDEATIPHRDILTLEEVTTTIDKLTVAKKELDRIADQISDLVNIVRPFGRS